MRQDPYYWGPDVDRWDPIRFLNDRQPTLLSSAFLSTLARISYVVVNYLSITILKMLNLESCVALLSAVGCIATPWVIAFL